MREARAQRATAGWLLVASLVASLVAGACGGSRGPTTRVTIPPGATMRIAAESLSRHGVIESTRLFRVYAAITRRDRAIKAGTYLLHRRERWGAVLDALHGGKGLMRVITIPEGFSLSQIEPLLAVRLHQPMDSVDAAVRDTALLRELDLPTPTLEGYLFPDTYKFNPGTTPKTIVQAMTQNFRKHFGKEMNYITTGLSPHETVTLASIVETEARLPQERPLVASVYLNRIGRRMLLGADPTVIYALKLAKRWDGNIRKDDLQIDSPYNTYRFPGLPPGPIANPGVASLRAAAAPAKSSYLYFVAKHDGSHAFSSSLEEHNRNVQIHQVQWYRDQRKAQAAKPTQ